MAFELSANVDVHRDGDGRIRTLRHLQAPFSPETAGLTDPSPVALADQYVREVAPLYGIDESQLGGLAEEALAEPAPEGTQLRRPELKTVQNITVASYPQTHLGLPVWQSALEVRMFGEPLRVVSSASTLDLDVQVEAPPPEALQRFTGDDRLELARANGLDDDAAQGMTLNGTRQLVYRYDPAQRLDPAVAQLPGGQVPGGSLPVLPLPPVPDGIEPGRHYVVREVLFSLALPDWGELNWRAFIEPGTGAVLYLRAFVASATACVFVTDPITATGNAVNACSPAGVFDPLRTTVTLKGLDPPDAAGNQALAGNFVVLTDTDPLTIAPPTTTSPFDFCYSAVTHDFSAACAYHHYDGRYRTLEGMGFDIAGYFDGTTFPVPVDHQGVGNQVNAFAIGNATGTGMQKFINGFAQSGCPVGIATDVRLTWHEFGHALLWDHVGSPNFGWCHSAGDTLAVINGDPGSLAPDRFLTFPWIPLIGRRHDRDVALGWAWGGVRDDTQYSSEQILSTLLFRVYRTTGGDDADIDIQRFAARYLTYLIVNAIGTLTTMTSDPAVYETAMEDADVSTLNFEGHPGGAWHKVIRWSFEQQGLFQPAGAPTPVTQPGAPPAVDVFVDDGRNGGYMPYLPDFTATTDIWNRHFPDGGTAHEEPLAGFPSFVHVRVRNRGTDPATDASVKLFHADPASGLVWPTAWTPAATAQLASSGPIPPGGQTVIGPFSWLPAAAGPISLLASVSAAGDASNADTVSGPIAHTRLVPLDNNLAQRDVTAQTANPCEQLGKLADYIVTLGLKHGLEQSLTAKLRNAKRDCERGHKTPACNKLGAFENEVEAQTDKGITPAQATVLRGHAHGIRVALGC
jgi:zinc metalloprotease ZmpB